MLCNAHLTCTSTTVHVRFDTRTSPWLSPRRFRRFGSILGQKMKSFKVFDPLTPSRPSHTTARPIFQDRQPRHMRRPRVGGALCLASSFSLFFSSFQRWHVRGGSESTAEQSRQREDIAGRQMHLAACRRPSVGHFER
ncbi:hypothetical protein CaCOL14_007192 [Colletotrichum acutatum]